VGSSISAREAARTGCPRRRGTRYAASAVECPHRVDRELGARRQPPSELAAWTAWLGAQRQPPNPWRRVERRAHSPRGPPSPPRGELSGIRMVAVVSGEDIGPKRGRRAGQPLDDPGHVRKWRVARGGRRAKELSRREDDVRQCCCRIAPPPSVNRRNGPCGRDCPDRRRARPALTAAVRLSRLTAAAAPLAARAAPSAARRTRLTPRWRLPAAPRRAAPAPPASPSPPRRPSLQNEEAAGLAPDGFGTRERAAYASRAAMASSGTALDATTISAAARIRGATDAR
jgi:hypothetical protein